MFRIDLPFTDAHLFLTPRLGGMSRFWQVAVLVLILAVVLFLIFWLYRYELKVIPKRFAILLAALRLCLVTSLFVVTSMKPRPGADDFGDGAVEGAHRRRSVGQPERRRPAAFATRKA